MLKGSTNPEESVVEEKARLLSAPEHKLINSISDVNLTNKKNSIVTRAEPVVPVVASIPKETSEDINIPAQDDMKIIDQYSNTTPFAR